MTKLSDVAKKAGVGVGTVSRVLNNSGPVSEKTRIKVNNAINELNYIPNETARIFKTQDPKTVAIIIPSIINPFYAKFTFYAENELEKYGYKLIICNSLLTKDIKYLQMLQQNKISGAICMSYNDIEDFLQEDFNLVFIDRIFNKNIAYVSSDNYKGGQMAGKYFHDTGIKNVAFMGTYSKVVTTESSNRRVGFKDYALEHNLGYFEFLEQDPIQDMSNFADSILSKIDNFQGIFCECDGFAVELYSKCMQKGIRVPEDLSIIGYDGIYNNPLFSPNLTTIVQPIEELAVACVEILMARLDAITVEKRTVLDVNLHIGNTTKPISSN